MFKQTIEDIKDVIQKYVNPESYDFSNATNKTNDDFPLSLKTGTRTVIVLSLLCC